VENVRPGASSEQPLPANSAVINMAAARAGDTASVANSKQSPRHRDDFLTAGERGAKRWKQLVADLNAHLPSSATDGAECRLFAARVEILHFDLHDLHDLLFRELRNF
jgi:hypothetical protein